ncbi:hypothetical protein ACNKHS_07765 [Shigella flexneri]
MPKKAFQAIAAVRRLGSMSAAEFQQSANGQAVSGDCTEKSSNARWRGAAPADLWRIRQHNHFLLFTDRADPPMDVAMKNLAGCAERLIARRNNV